MQTWISEHALTLLVMGCVIAAWVFALGVAAFDAWQDWRYARRNGIDWTYHCRYRNRRI